jgi:hypothetical protein
MCNNDRSLSEFCGTALGDIALVSAQAKAPSGIRDVADWYISTVSRQEYIHTIFAANRNRHRNLKRIYG